jgi:hypothetical protein
LVAEAAALDIGAMTVGNAVLELADASPTICT